VSIHTFREIKSSQPLRGLSGSSGEPKMSITIYIYSERPIHPSIYLSSNALTPAHISISISISIYTYIPFARSHPAIPPVGVIYLSIDTHTPTAPPQICIYLYLYIQKYIPFARSNPASPPVGVIYHCGQPQCRRRHHHGSQHLWGEEMFSLQVAHIRKMVRHSSALNIYIFSRN